MKLDRLTLTLIVVVPFTKCGCVSEPKHSAPTFTEAELAHARRMAESAGKALDFIVQERDVAQRALTPQYFEECHVWSRRLATSQYALANNREERLSFVAAYVEEMRRLDNLMKRRFTESPRNVGMTEFYVAEAELWFERVKRE